MHMSREHDNTEGGVRLLFFQYLGQCLFGSPGLVASRRKFALGRTGVRRMVKHQEDEIDICRYMVQLFQEPLSLCTDDLLLRTIQDQKQSIAGPHGIKATVF